jgi:hypothetical protein
MKSCAHAPVAVAVLCALPLGGCGTSGLVDAAPLDASSDVLGRADSGPPDGAVGSEAADAFASVCTGCVPRSCAQVSVECGTTGDGCGGPLDCGPCPFSETCSSFKCIPPADTGPCVPATCQQLGYDCGLASDGCGGQIHCGTCAVGQYCGGGGLRRCGGTCVESQLGGCSTVVCSALDAGVCWTAPCGSQDCGLHDNGCGGLVDCGPCDGGASPDADAGSGAGG